jgi:hypothetical protein
MVQENKINMQYHVVDFFDAHTFFAMVLYAHILANM